MKYDAFLNHIAKISFLSATYNSNNVYFYVLYFKYRLHFAYNTSTLLLKSNCKCI